MERTISETKMPPCRAATTCRKRRQAAWGGRFRSFFINLQALYWGCRREPDMAINGRRNKPFGPGGSTRRLHPSPLPYPPPHAGEGKGGGFRRGRNRIDEGVKGALLLGMVP